MPGVESSWPCAEALGPAALAFAAAAGGASVKLAASASRLSIMTGLPSSSHVRRGSLSWPTVTASVATTFTCARVRRGRRQWKHARQHPLGPWGRPCARVPASRAGCSIRRPRKKKDGVRKDGVRKDGLARDNTVRYDTIRAAQGLWRTVSMATRPRMAVACL